MKNVTTDELVGATSAKNSKKTSTKTSKPYHQRVEDWSKGTLAPFLSKVIILVFSVWGLWDVLQRAGNLPEGARGSLATVIVLALIAGASMKKSRR